MCYSFFSSFFFTLHCTFTVPCIIQHIHISDVVCLIVSWHIPHSTVVASRSIPSFILLLALTLMLLTFLPQSLDYINRKCCTVIRTHILILGFFRAFHTNYMQSCQKLQGTQWHTTMALNVMTWHKILAHKNPKWRSLGMTEQKSHAERERERPAKSRCGSNAKVHGNVFYRKRKCKKWEIVQIQRRKKLLFI